MEAVNDLTRGSVVRHLLTLSAPVLALMIFQATYLLVDLYFVARLGDAAIGGVSMAANVTFIVAGITQIISVGSVALISQAVGRKDRQDAKRIFTQSVALSLLCGVVVIVGGYPLTRAYVGSLAGDAATLAAGIDYLYWYMPALALQFTLSAVASALQGAGIVRPTVVVYSLTIIVNVVLAPVLIAGWGTGHPMGVAGAGLASSIGIAIGVICLWWYFLRVAHYVAFDRNCVKPSPTQWKRILDVGLPAGAEMLLMFVQATVIYWVIRRFGPAAQAGFGIGSRVLQMLILPVVAISFAAGPIVGQNFGAGEGGRVRRTFHAAGLLNAMVMLACTVLMQVNPSLFVHMFTDESDVVAVGASFLQLVSLGFVARGVVYTCTSLFQGLGNTRPSLVSSATSLATFALVAIVLSEWQSYRIEYVWYLSVATVVLQATLSLLFLHRELSRRLPPVTLMAARA